MTILVSTISVSSRATEGAPQHRWECACGMVGTWAPDAERVRRFGEHHTLTSRRHREWFTNKQVRGGE